MVDVPSTIIDAGRKAYCTDRHPNWDCNQKTLEDEMVRRMVVAMLETGLLTLASSVSGDHK